MGALAGFIVGYMLGVKAGPEGFEELRKAWQVVVNSEEFQGLLAMGGGFLESLTAQGREAAIAQLEALTAKDGHAQSVIGGSAELISAWQRISSSQEFQALLSGGMSLIGGVIEQGTARFAQRAAAEPAEQRHV